MAKINLLLATLLVTISSSIFGMNFQHRTIHQGLSNNIVYSISKDPKGILWFGTRTGIDRYDGHYFTHYNLKSPNQELSEANIAKYIHCDPTGKLWVGTLNGLFYFNPGMNRFEQVKGANNKELSTIRINTLLTDSEGNLWIGADNTAYIYNHKSDSVIKIPEINTPVLSMHQIDKENLLMGTESGILNINIKTYRIGSYSEKLSIKENLQDAFCYSIFEDNENRLWFCSLNHGILVIDKETHKTYKHPKLNTLIPKGVMIKKIIALDSNQYAIGADGIGLIIVNKELQPIATYSHNEDEPSSLSNNGVYDLIKDSEGRLWISTYGGGINVYDPNLLPFRPIQHKTNSSNSLSNNTGRAIMEDSMGRLWFGTKKGISILDPKTNSWKHIHNTKKNPHRLGSNTILSICQVNENKIWVGSYGGGINKIDLHSLKSSPLLSSEEFKKKIGSIYIYKILKDSDGDIWIGSIRQPIKRYNPTTKTITKYPISNVQAIYEGKNKKILLGSRDGFYMLNKQSGEFKLFSPNPEDPQSLSSEACFCFCEDLSGNIYIGTEGGGLNIYSPTTEKFEYYTKKDGLPTNTIYGILPDQSGNLWLSTTNGLSMFNPKSKKFVNYDISDGLTIKEFNYGASYKTRNGEMIFGGESGFLAFTPSKIKKINLIPKLFFTDLKISNKSLPIGHAENPLQQHIDLTSQINLNYNQNSFSLDFVGINFTNPVKNRYSWKLEGFDQEWTPASTKHTATYTNIPPGEYVFKVRTSNLQDIWNGKERVIMVRITPPFYQTWWAFAIYMLILGGIAFFIIKFYKIQLQEKHSNEKVQFFINVAHDLKTPLTLIKSPLTSLFNKGTLPQDENDLISMALKNVDKLTTHFTQLLDFQKAEMKKMQLQVDKHNIVEHLTDTTTSFKPLIDKKRIKFQILSEKNIIDLWYDRLQIEKVFYNLISNAIKYTPEDEKITIRINTHRNSCILNIIDSGIGIPEDQQQNIFKRYYRATNAINSEETGSGVGLLLVKQLVDLHGGKISFSSVTNKGTCFTLKFRMDRSHYKPSDFISDKSAEKYIPVFKTTGKSSEEKHNRESLTTDMPNNQSDLPKLLIVEDSKELITFLSNELMDEYNIQMASNGIEALEIIDQTEPDIIISDIMMPKMDGRVFCAHLKKNIETCHIPIILVTALTSSDYKIEGYELGADGYIEKPFDLRILKSKISNLLNSHKILKDKFLKQEDTSEQINYKNELDQEFIQKCMDIVNENMDNPEFSVEEFSKSLFMSRPVLYRKLKALTGQSPQDYIKIIRLKKSVELIKEGRYSIGEIAYQTGFSDPKYFSTSFKKFYGVSPSKYGKQ